MANKKKETLLDGLSTEEALDLCLFSLRDVADSLENGSLSDKGSQILFAHLLRGDFGLW